MANPAPTGPLPGSGQSSPGDGVVGTAGLYWLASRQPGMRLTSDPVLIRIDARALQAPAPECTNSPVCPADHGIHVRIRTTHFHHTNSSGPMLGILYCRFPGLGSRGLAETCLQVTLLDVVMPGERIGAAMACSMQAGIDEILSRLSGREG